MAALASANQTMTEPSDVTSQPRSPETLMRLYAQAAPLARFGAWECDLPTQRLSWTDGVYDLFGIARGAVVHRPSIVDLYRDASRRRMERARAACVTTGAPFTIDCEIRTIGGEARWMRLSGGVAHEHGRSSRLFGSKLDITHEKTLWRQLEQQLSRDPLTGLSNRRAFDGLLERLRHGLTDGVELALALIDVDGFAAFNARHGGGAGDACLRAIAERLGRTLPGAPMLARIGADEFAVVIVSRLGRRALRRTLDGVRRALAQPLEWNGATLPVSVSTGVAFAGNAPQSEPQALFVHADSALFVARAQGGGALQVFGEALDPLAAIVTADPLRDTG